MAIKAVFFDMDGTLVNSLNDLAVSTNYALDKNGYEKKPIENYADYQGNGVYVMIERALAPKVVSKEELTTLRNDFFDYYKNHCTDYTTVYDGMRELVETLKTNGIIVGCITNKVEKIAINIIEYFFGGMDIVAGQIDGVPNKPDPYQTNEAMKTLNLKPEECLFVGDTNVDINTAAAACVKSVGCLWGFRTKEELIQAGADYIVSDPSEIWDLVKNDK